VTITYTHNEQAVDVDGFPEDVDDFDGEPETDPTPYMQEDYDFHNEQQAAEDDWLESAYEDRFDAGEAY